MGRDVHIRTSFQGDIGYLTRFMRAVELDSKRPPAWKRRIISMLQDLTVELLNEQRRMVRPLGRTKGG